MKAKKKRVSKRVPQDEEFERAFILWWEKDGQYCRAGGGSYEKTFAYHAWMQSAKRAATKSR